MKHANLKPLVGETWIWPLGKGFDHFTGEIVPFLKKEFMEGKTIFPQVWNIFRALKEVPFETIRVVILGQDPYHNVDKDTGVNPATGLCFDNPKIVKASPSLRNILQEIKTDTLAASLAETNTRSYLEHLPSQGVLLLNVALTVEKGSPRSHLKVWKPFTEELITQINTRLPNVVWVLWGLPAQRYKKLIVNKSHKIIESNHPSPFSASKGFFGSKPFTKVNSFLKQPIKW